MTLFGDRAFSDIIKLQLGQLQWALIQYDWHPYKRKIWTKTPTEGRPCKTQGEDSHPHAKGRGKEQIPPSWPPERTNPAHTLISDFQPPELGDEHFCCLSPPVCGTVTAA